jgi:hypothetical protein
MIYTIIADISRVDERTAEQNIDKIYYFKLILDKRRNERQRRDSIGGYLTLYQAYERIFGKEMPTIRKWKNCKPRFKKPWEQELIGFVPPDPNDKTPEVDFNISHSGDIALVSLMWDEGEGRSVGVDVQTTAMKRVEENVGGHLLTTLDFSGYKQLDAEHKFFCTTLEANGDFMYFCEADLVKGRSTKNAKPLIFINERLNFENSYLHFEPKCRSVAEDFYVAWTLAEATLKATGRGFAGYKMLDSYLKESECMSAKFNHLGKEYYISIALGEKKPDDEIICYWELPLEGYEKPNPRGPNGEFYPPRRLSDLEGES